MRTIKLEIDEKGRVKALYEGFVGEMCLTEATKLINGLKSLGVDVDIEDLKRTSEFYVKEKEAVKSGQTR